MSNFVHSENIKTIAYLGTSGSFTEMAKDYFCAKYNLDAYQMPFRTIKEIISYLHPRSVKKIKIEGKPLEHETLRATNVYFMTYMVIFAVSVLLVSIENKDLVTNFAAVAATFNNIGPGLSLVGPMANFGHFTDFTKYILMFDMLAGRLEIFPMMLLFCPAVWKRRRA